MVLGFSGRNIKKLVLARSSVVNFAYTSTSGGNLVAISVVVRSCAAHQTDCPGLRRDVGVPNLGDEFHLGRLERVAGRYVDVDQERAPFERRALWAQDGALKVSEGVPLGRGRNPRIRVPRAFCELLSDAPCISCRHVSPSSIFWFYRARKTRREWSKAKNQHKIRRFQYSQRAQIPTVCDCDFLPLRVFCLLDKCIT